MVRRIALLCLLATAVPAGVARASVVIGEVYGGGGNPGATYKNDFVELFNDGDAAQSLAGWTVQYTSATNSIWTVTALAGTMPAGSRYLVGEAAGGAGTTDLPATDATGTINMSATAGKVALVTHSTALTGATPPASAYVDLVGYGASPSAFEGTGPAPAPSNTMSISRAATGCQDSNDNAADFAVGAPTPAGSSATVSRCPAITAPAVVQATEATGVSIPISTVGESAVTVSGIAPDAADPAAPVVTGSGDAWTLTWTPGFDRAAAGPYTATLTASDGTTSVHATVVIAVANLDRAPIPDAGGDRSVTAGQSLHFVVAASDADGDPVTLAATGLPAGAAFTAGTGAVDWTPANADVGVHTLVFSASDGELTTTTVTRVTVIAPALVPGPKLGPPSAIKAVLASAKLSSTHVSAKGTKLIAKLSAPGTIVLTIDRCTGRGCTALKGSIRRTAKRGTNTLTFRPRLNGRALKKGTYRLHVAISGQRRGRTLRFTVV
jgi:hypothetical protein